MSSENNPPPFQILQIAPLFPIALGMVVGIVLDRSLTPPEVIYSIPLIVATMGVFFPPVRRRLGFYCVLFAAVSAGGLLHDVSARVIPANSIERYATTSGTPARLRGVVINEPRLFQPPRTPFATWVRRTQRTGFVMAIASIAGENDTIPASGFVRVTVLEPVLDLREGDAVEIFGRLYAIQSPDNPGSFDWKTFYRNRGIVATMRCKHREAIVRTKKGSTDPGSTILKTLRQHLRHLLVDETMSQVDGASGLLEGMVLGQRSRVSRVVNDLFIRAGCVHFLAVSGVHLVIVMWLARTMAGFLGATGRVRVFAMMAAIVFYALVVEPRPPILRASIIGMIYCIACLLHRQRTCLNWISACVIVLAILNPGMVFDVGYQLSTAAVIGVSYLAPALQPWIAAISIRLILLPGFLLRQNWNPFGFETDLPIPQRRWFQRLGHWTYYKLVEGFSITLAAWLAALPIVAAVFFHVYPWGMINSLLLLPVVTLVMALAFAKMIVAVVSPTASTAFSGGLVWFSGRLLDLVDRLGHLPGAFAMVAKPPLYLICAYYLALLMFVLASGKRWPHKIEKENLPKGQDRGTFLVPRWTSNAAFVILGIAAVAWLYPATDSGKLTVTALSVGRASTTVIELPTGESLLYDAGSSHLRDPGRSTIVPYLLTRGITSVRRVWISHPNLDHFSGIPSLVETLKTGPIAVNRWFRKRSGTTSNKLLRILHDLDHPIETLRPSLNTQTYGDVSIDYLWPTGETDDTYTTNDTSTVLRIRFAGKSVLLTGDIEAAAERTLLGRGGLSADVLFLPHHGSVTQATSAFVSAVHPVVVVRSSSERTSDTINGLNEITRPYPTFNTADVGAVEITLEVDGITVRTARNPPVKISIQRPFRDAFPPR